MINNLNDRFGSCETGSTTLTTSLSKPLPYGSRYLLHSSDVSRSGTRFLRRSTDNFMGSSATRRGYGTDDGVFEILDTLGAITRHV